MSRKTVGQTLQAPVHDADLAAAVAAGEFSKTVAEGGDLTTDERVMLQAATAELSEVSGFVHGLSRLGYIGETAKNLGYTGETEKNLGYIGETEENINGIKANFGPNFRSAADYFLHG